MIFPFRDDVPAHRTPWVTYLIVAANVAALIWLTRLPPLEQNAAAYKYGFIPLRIAQLSVPQVLPLQVPVPAQAWFCSTSHAGQVGAGPR